MKYIATGTLALLLNISFAVVPAAHAEDRGGSTPDSCSLPGNGKISGRVDLQSGCVYSSSIVIADSGTHLACHGAVLDGGGTLKDGLIISGKGGAIHDVVVEDCVIKNFTGKGVLVTSGLKMWEWSKDVQDNYKKGPTRISLKGLLVDNVGGVGVYFDSYATDSELRASTVQKSGRVGIYLEQGSRNIKIADNKIAKNGSKTTREGLAVDSSAQNIIEGNRFIENAAGGVFLYKNCGEKFSTGKSTIRWQHSDQNTIRNNLFQGEHVGVWVASRQSKNLGKWDCGDPSVDMKGQYFRDYADNNSVVGNHFCGGGVGVRLEGNGNVINNNSFDSAKDNWVEEPYQTKPLPGGGRTRDNRGAGNIEDRGFCGKGG